MVDPRQGRDPIFECAAQREEVRSRGTLTLEQQAGSGEISDVKFLEDGRPLVGHMCRLHQEWNLQGDILPILNSLLDPWVSLYSFFLFWFGR